MTVEIASSEGLAGSIAHVVGQGSVKPGDVLALDRWVVPAKAGLRVSIPKPAPEAAVERAVAEFGKLRGDAAIDWLDDPTAGAPTHVVSWNGSAWILETNPATKPAILGAEPTAADVKRLLPPKARLLVRLPPTASLAAGDSVGRSRSFGGGDRRHHRSRRRAILVLGKDRRYRPRVCLVAPRFHRGQRRAMPPQTARPGSLPLPIRSDWVKLPPDPEGVRAAGADLTKKALLLARIRAWLTLQSPPSQETFPYHLAFRQVADGALGEFKDSGDFKEGEQYKLYLRADPSALAARRLARAALGLCLRNRPLRRLARASFLRPAAATKATACPMPRWATNPISSRSSRSPANRPKPISKSVRPSAWTLISCSPATTPSTIPKCSNFEGVRTEAGTRGASDPLTALLSSASSMTRGVSPRPVPALWSIETLTFRSVPKDGGK